MKTYDKKPLSAIVLKLKAADAAMNAVNPSAVVRQAFLTALAIDMLPSLDDRPVGALDPL